MTLSMSGTSSDQDWRLRAELDARDKRHVLDGLLGRVRPSGPIDDVAAATSHDTVVTHDGNVLFAYAPTRSALERAREAIEAALRADAVIAAIQTSHWDDRVDEWVQVDPPLGRAAKRDAEARER